MTATQLSGGQWVGPAVRGQNGGQNLYLGLYFWNYGSPQLMLFKRVAGNWTQLGASYPSGPLAAGTQLRLSVVGSSLSFSANGVVRITVNDTTLSAGAPAIMAYGTPRADNWTGDNATSSVATYTIGGTVSGLSGTVVLDDDDGDNLSVTANGLFTFATPLADGSAYLATVQTNPPGQTCALTNPSGTVTAANVTNLSVTCTTNPAGGNFLSTT